MQRLPNRAVLRLSGPETLALLERTVTQSVAGWHEGEARYGALLTPQGKVISDYTALRTQDGVLIDAPEGAAADLLKRLILFRLRAKVDITLAPELSVALDPHGFADPRHSDLPSRAFVPSDQAPDVFTGWDAIAITAGVPEWGRDYGAAEVFPTDVNMDLMGAIDYSKGCFVGQEVASRMKRKGGVRKRTVRVRGAALSAGADILAGGPVGRVTSCAGELGLAIIRLDRFAAALGNKSDVTVNEAAAQIEAPGGFVNEAGAAIMERD